MNLVEEAKLGNKEAFHKLIEDNKLKMYKVAKSILKNEDDVCDAIQNALMSAYTNLSKLKNNQYFSTWITRILINKCYDIARENQKRYSNVIDITEYNTDEGIKTYDNYNSDSIVENVLNKIDEDLKTITVLYYYNDYSVTEISEILSIPEGTVKSRLSRARNKIYEIIKREEEAI
ncbi:MAG: sigma-70 family RNA polymerase sigma factor [Clostridia bacterium]|nr:sigma-70 family RNA polymerase sigma factor [Clostridia bacterium]